MSDAASTTSLLLSAAELRAARLRYFASQAHSAGAGPSPPPPDLPVVIISSSASASDVTCVLLSVLMLDVVFMSQNKHVSRGRF
jgi:hypothetical protein